MREIGTRFWYEFPVRGSSSLSVQHRFLYEVTDNKEGRETLQAIRMQTRRITALRITVSSQGDLIYDCDFGSWNVDINPEDKQEDFSRSIVFTDI